MRKIVFALLLVLAATLGFAQAKPNDQPKYDPRTEVSVDGVVTEVRDFQCDVTGTMGRHLEMKMQDGTVLEVHVAPVKFLTDFKIPMKTGWTKVIGSKVTYMGKPAVIARVVSQDQTTYLRDVQGNPYW